MPGWAGFHLGRREPVAQNLQRVLRRLAGYRTPLRAVIGAWSHGYLNHGSPYAAPGGKLQPDLKALWQEMLDFFDTHLKKQTGSQPESGFLDDAYFEYLFAATPFALDWSENTLQPLGGVGAEEVALRGQFVARLELRSIDQPPQVADADQRADVDLLVLPFALDHGGVGPAYLGEHLAGLLSGVSGGGGETASHAALLEPVEPAWVVASLGVGYDEAGDRILIVATELLEDEEGGDQPATARFRISTAQAAAFVEVSRALVKAGRPICPMCSQPKDPGGHVCPRANGHLAGRA